MPNPAYIYIYIYIYSERETEKVIDRQRQREGEKMVKRHQKFHWIYLERGLISRHLFIWLNEISTYYGYLMPNPAYIYIYIYIYSERETEKVIDRRRQREGEKMVKRHQKFHWIYLERGLISRHLFIWLNEISTYYGYLMPNPAYIYIYIYIYSERETEKVIDRDRGREKKW